MRKKSILLSIITLAAAVLCALGIAACSNGEYEKGNKDVPAIITNEVLFIERNRLSLAKDMADFDDYDVIERCHCTLIGSNGDEIKVTADAIRNGLIQAEKFDLSEVGSNKRIKISCGNAVNYIFYDVNEYTVNLYTDEEQTELWQSVPASAALNSDLALAVWVNIAQYNYSTDETARAYDADRAILFDGWYDPAGDSATGYYTLAAPVTGNERVLNLHAHYITPERLADMNIYYDNLGRRVFGGYTGSGKTVNVPEGVTYINMSETFEAGFTFNTLNIPSTASMDLPLITAYDTVGLTEINVNAGNFYYSSFNGALYSKDHSTLLLMPSSNANKEFHADTVELGSYSCAFWRIDEITVPESIKTFQHYCFAYSTISQIHGLQNVKTIMAGVFYKSNINSYIDRGIAQYTVLTGEAEGQYILSMMLDKSITEYKLIDGTISIAGDVFNGCANLQSIDFGDDLLSIGSSAFSGCASLQSVTFPSSLKYLGSNIFYDCNALTTLNNLPDVTYLDTDGREYAHTLPMRMFYDCSALENVTLPNGLESIGVNAFHGCSALKSINIPQSVLRIGQGAFYSCGITEIDLPEGLTYLGVQAFSHSGLTSIDLSVCTQLTELSRRCFEYTKLKELVVPDRIQVIPEYCFYYITTLKKITLNGVTEIETYAFGRCTALTDIEWNSLKIMRSSAFRSDTSLTAVALPDSTEIVESYAFASCSKLTSISLGKNLRVFGEYIFDADGKTFDVALPVLYSTTRLQTIEVDEENRYFSSHNGVLYGDVVCGENFGKNGVLYAVPCAYNATTLELPVSVRVIVPYAVHSQSKLEHIALNDGLQNIGKAAFYNSKKLAELELPSSVSHIGASILLSCTGIGHFSIAEGNPTYSTDGNLVYSGDTLVMYLGFNPEVTVRDGVTKIADAVFMNNTVMTSIVIPDSVISIGANAFNGCAKLSSIFIGSGLSEIGTAAFAKLSSLSVIAVSMSNDSYKALNGVLYTKDGKTLVLAAANNGMTSLEIDENVTEIGEWAFAYHKTLESVILPGGVRAICDYSFYECRSVTTFIGSESLESIGERAFSFADSITPADTTETRFCDTLKTVMLYSKVTEVGDNAFYGQYGIEYVFFNMNMTQVLKVIGGKRNIVYLTHGCPNGTTGTYYNNVTRCIYSETPPTINYDGYEWFYIEDGVPQIWQISDTERSFV